MSDMQEFSAVRAEESANQENRFDPMAVLPAHDGQQKIEGNKGLKEIDESLDGQSYFLGEVPQGYLADPQAFLPLNSDHLIGTVNMVEKLLSDVGLLIQEEVNQIQKAQKKINLWEDRIEKNKAIVQNHLTQVKQNLVDISYDKKNRDFWWGRAEHVLADYSHAEAANRSENWAWLVKKYGLKNPDGTQVDENGNCVEELCNGAADNLATEYKVAGNKYDQLKKDKETENTRMIRENSRLLATNEQLQEFISKVYTDNIEPLQDGVLLYKELGAKLKALGQEGNKSTYGDLRSWGESFVDEFLRANPRAPAYAITEFRRMTSIPLPSQNS